MHPDMHHHAERIFENGSYVGAISSFVLRVERIESPSVLDGQTVDSGRFLTEETTFHFDFIQQKILISTHPSCTIF
jgi:hypothetical protein